MDFIVNQKGGRKLVYDGFMYTMKKQSQVSVTWECSKKAGENCFGKLVFSRIE